MSDKILTSYISLFKKKKKKERKKERKIEKLYWEKWQ